MSLPITKTILERQICIKLKQKVSLVIKGECSIRRRRAIPEDVVYLWKIILCVLCEEWGQGCKVLAWGAGVSGGRAVVVDVVVHFLSLIREFVLGRARRSRGLGH